MLESEAFKYMTKLINLNLNQNFLIDINNFTFQSMSLLNYLDLSENSISTVYKETFNGLISLFSININQNYLTSLNDYTFSDFYEKSTIILSNNQE